jgi:hypothetical protein
VRRPLVSAVAVALLAVIPQAWAATIAGTRGPDRIASNGNGTRDRVSCGAGRDLVNADLADLVAADCEVVSLQLSRDATTAFGAQHETQVEPDSFAFGRTIVAAFQSGRYEDGGAAGTGWATSQDAGSTWRSGFLPMTSERVSDPVVTYDAVHGVWLIAILGVSEGNLSILLSRSQDGVRWETPVAAVDPAVTGANYDKEWIACDNWPGSRFRGRCYLSYLNIDKGQLETRWSADGGATWSAAAATAPGQEPSLGVNGALPVVRPDGTLVVGFVAIPQFSLRGPSWIGASRSTDGGTSFGAPVRVADLEYVDVLGMRAPPLPSFDVDGGGTVYATWADCRFHTECTASDVVLATSPSGEWWAPPTRVPTRNPLDQTDQFIPGVAVDPATAGRSARVAITYYSLRPPGSCPFDSCAGLNVSMIQSANGGTRWGRPQRLNAQPMRLEWLADGGIGKMVGDYISTSWAGGRVVPVFSLASADDGFGTFRQATFAGTRVG